MACIFDSHAHYDDARFERIREELLSSMPQNNVCGIINCGTDVSSSRVSLNLAKKYDFMYAAVGYHPESIDDSTVFDEKAMRELISHQKTVAIGEIGLDYYWDTTFKEQQLALFERQLDFANKNNMPVIIHDREAHGDTLALLQKYKPKGVLHCFSGSVEMAAEAVKSGLYIGLGGVITFKNSKKAVEVAESVPIDRILLETDAPYLAPEPNRGRLNRSDYIKFVAEKLAEIKNLTLEEVLDSTVNNTKALFNIEF